MATETIVPTMDYEVADELVCAQCGVRNAGEHRNADECINALRSVIGTLEMRLESAKESAAINRQKARTDNRRHVVLDGERLSICDAASKIGISIDALAFRLRPFRHLNLSAVDLRELGIAEKNMRGGVRCGSGRSREGYSA